jgi:flagellar motor component MotA
MRGMAILFAVGLFVGGILAGSRFTLFVDPRSLVLVLGGLLVPLAVHGSAVGLPFAALRRGLPEARRRLALVVVRDLERATFGGAALASVIVVIQMLQNLSDPTAFGPALAVMTLPLFYALALRLFVWQALAGRLHAAEPAPA